MIASGPSDIDPHVAPLSPTQSFQRLHECGDSGGLVCFDCPAHEHADVPHAVSLLRTCRDRPRRRAAEPRDELAAPHVWMAPAWQEIIWRAAQRSLAVMCPACWCSPGGLLALMGSANRVLIIRTGSMSR